MTSEAGPQSGESLTDDGNQEESVTVVVIAICGLPQLRRTLDVLIQQENAPSFEIVVAADPRLGDLQELEQIFPAVTFLVEPGRLTPIELSTMGLEAARGERILLTEDSCIPDRHWVGELVRTPWHGHGAVGGVIEPGASASAAMWAFYYVDFFRYMRPATAGATPTLSVCNVAYHRSHLEAVRDLWKDGFHESEVHDALRKRFGPLYLCPAAEVRVRRNVRFSDAVYERYAFGRLFGATRVAHTGRGRRLYYAAFSPALPALLLTRMTSTAAKSRTTRARFLKALPSIAAMVLAWSWGEWLGYATNRRPERITTAPEITEHESEG
jgi:hypothetical protein